jgi:hypothetical protein
MIKTLLLVGAASALIALPAAAQLGAGSAATGAVNGAAGAAGAAGAGPTGTALPPGATSTDPTGAATAAGSATGSAAGRTTGAMSSDMGASTGSAANTSATVSDLKTGATVSDSAGMSLGKISKVTKGKTSADTMVTLSADGKTKTVPASSLSMSGGALVSTASRTDVWGNQK